MEIHLARTYRSLRLLESASFTANRNQKRGLRLKGRRDEEREGRRERERDQYRYRHVRSLSAMQKKKVMDDSWMILMKSLEL